MADEVKKEEKKEEVKKEDILAEIQKLKDKNAELEEIIKQKDLQLAKFALGGEVKKETKEVEEDSPEFDFDF